MGRPCRRAGCRDRVCRGGTLAEAEKPLPASLDSPVKKRVSRDRAPGAEPRNIESRGLPLRMFRANRIDPLLSAVALVTYATILYAVVYSLLMDRFTG